MISYGHDRTRPRTEVFLDSSNLGSANVASEKPLVLMGSAIGGEPKVAHSITNYAQAKDIFRGGPLLDAIELAWNPSPEEQGAGRIIAMRTDEATQAKVEKEGLTVVSKLYGSDANSIQISYTDNELTNSKRFSVFFTKERYERVYDNIGNIFTVQYVGEEAQATIQIDVDSKTNKASKLILSVGEDADNLIPVRTYELGEGVYEDVHVLVNDINNLPDFEASMNSLGGNKNISTSWLDQLEAVNIKNEEATITAVAGDLINVTENDRYIKVEVDMLKPLPESIDLVNLEGALTEPAPASWSSMFETIADLGAYYIVPLTDNEAIHGELSQMLRDESNNGNQMRGIVGGAFDESMEKLRSRQMNLRASRIAITGNSGKRRMFDGRVLHFPGYMTAALIGGIASGLPIGEPVTYKHANVESLDHKFTGDQLDQLDASGVIMLEFVRNRASTYFRVVSDPTTYNVASEPVKNRMSLGEVSDFLTTDLRTIMDEEFIGTRTHNMSAAVIKNRVESFLDEQKKVGGLIVDYNPDDVQVIVSGRSARINFTVQPAQGLEYINVYISYEDQEIVA